MTTETTQGPRAAPRAPQRRSAASSSSAAAVDDREEEDWEDIRHSVYLSTAAQARKRRMRAGRKRRARFLAGQTRVHSSTVIYLFVLILTALRKLSLQNFAK